MKGPCCPAAVIGEFVSMGNAEIAVSYESAECIGASIYVTGRNLGKTETNDDPRARKPAYDKIHCLTYER